MKNNPRISYEQHLVNITKKHKGKPNPKSYYSIEFITVQGSLLFVDELEFKIFGHENVFDEGINEMVENEPNYFASKRSANAALKAIHKALNFKPIK